ncbi:MAG: DUF6514 family protein [Clostridia bacterium]
MENGSVMYKEVVCENGTKLTITYSTVMNELILSCGAQIESFGLRIQSFENGEIPVDSVEILDITQSALEIDSIIMVLFTYTVTPATVYDVLDDYLAAPESFMAALPTG